MMSLPFSIKALLTVCYSHLLYNVFQHVCEVTSGNGLVSAPNCLTSTRDYIVMQMRKMDSEKAIAVAKSFPCRSRETSSLVSLKPLSRLQACSIFISDMTATMVSCSNFFHVMSSPLCRGYLTSNNPTWPPRPRHHVSVVHPPLPHAPSLPRPFAQ